MLKILRSLFCRHTWLHHANLYGDQINAWGGNRSLWHCAKCGRLQARPELQQEHGPC